MNWKVIFNPFFRYTERQLLIVGLFFMVVTGFVCFYTQTYMNSVFHFATTENLNLSSAFMYILICYSTTVVFLFILALFFNKKTRVIDIVNTVLISQILNFIILLITKFSGLDKFSKSIKKAVETNQLEKLSINTILLLIITLPVLAIAVYEMVLLFNGFKTATNIKKTEHIIAFIVLLFIFLLVHQICMQYVEL